MNLEKAIELNKESVASLRQNKFPDHADAVQLGIEALRRVDVRRDKLSWRFEPLLPGETSPDAP